MKDIVKVQRPLRTNDPLEPWLIYDESRARQSQIPASSIPKYAKDAMGSDHKAFFKGSWSSAIGWSLLRRVEDQPW
jgi:hypothetical protein